MTEEPIPFCARHDNVCFWESSGGDWAYFIGSLVVVFAGGLFAALPVVLLWFMFYR